VKKYETVCNELDKKVIGLYARGMSVDDIKSEIDELYGIDISPSMISKITDKVMDTAIAWQTRSLDAVYPYTFSLLVMPQKIKINSDLSKLIYTNQWTFSIKNSKKYKESYFY
jgi:hypothetical protein